MTLQVRHSHEGEAGFELKTVRLDESLCFEFSVTYIRFSLNDEGSTFSTEPMEQP